jgi:hypothetical protein
MEHTATITDVSWHPMHVINSIISIGVRVPGYGFDVFTREEAPEEILMKKYHIEPTKEGWKNALIGKRCIVDRDDRGFKFVKFVD